VGTGLLDNPARLENGCYRARNTQRSQNTRQEILSEMRRRNMRAERPYKSQLVNELVELFGYHRNAALRALRPKPVVARALRPGSASGILAGETAAAAQGDLAGGVHTRVRISFLRAGETADEGQPSSMPLTR